MGSQLIRKKAEKIETPDADSRVVLDAIRHLVRTLRESSRSAEKAVGLSGAQLFVLQTLEREGPLSLSALASHTLTHQSSVSVVVGKLVEASLVARAVATDDHRKLELSLTAAGRGVLKRAPRVVQDQLFDALRAMPARERKQLAASLTGLMSRLNIEGAAPMFEEASRGDD